MRVLKWIGVILFQLVAVVSTMFLVSLLTFPYTEDPATQSGAFVLFTGLAITLGATLAGWLALRNRWFGGQPSLLPRLAGSALGAYLPLIVVLLSESMIRSGHPVITVAMLTGILGFHLPGLVKTRSIN